MLNTGSQHLSRKEKIMHPTQNASLQALSSCEFSQTGGRKNRLLATETASISTWRSNSQHWLIGCLAFTLVWGACQAAFAVDAIDRLAPERLEAVHRAVLTLKSARIERIRPGTLRDYRANLHVHSAFSHDSRGTIEDIVAAAKRAETDVVMFTEHPAAHYDVYVDGHQGMRDGVLLIQGAETKGMLVYPRQRFQAFESTDSQEMSDIVVGRGGLTFLSHLEERMDWNLRGLTGVEIYNTHADAKDEKRLFASLKNPLWLFKSASLIRQYPQEAFSALQNYPADYLKRWDELCIQTPHTGISANDAHQNIGIAGLLAEEDKVRIEDGLGKELLTMESSAFATFSPIPNDTKVGATLFRVQLDSYENSLRHVGTHLLAPELSQPAVWQALQSGRAYVAFDWIANAKGFDFAASSGQSRHEMGSQIRLSPDLVLTGQSPHFARWKLIRNGELAAEWTGADFELPVREAGNYRIELWLDVAGEEQIWVLSNPIYVGV